jgi:molybdate transport system substrate-binding protein
VSISGKFWPAGKASARLFISIALISGILAGTVACSAKQKDPTLTGAKNPGDQETLTAFAAASLTEAFTELGGQFESENPGTEMTFNFAGSQQLAQQIAQGAPADVFASADRKQMDAAIEAGRVDSDNVQALITNQLVVITPKDNPADVQSLADLARPGMKMLLAAEAVPVGRYSLEFLDKASQDPELGAGFKEAVVKNVVSYEENVRAVLSKVQLGEADAGIVYTSDVASTGAGEIGTLEIPDSLNVVATYYIAPLEDSPAPDLARSFIDYVLSPPGQQILSSYGFLPVK